MKFSIGAVTGLTVTYFVGTESYLSQIETAGLRIVVHMQDDPIFPDVMGVSVPSGYQTSLGIKKVSR